MKKTSVYFLVPLIAVLLFGVVYWQFTSADDAKEKQRIVDRRMKRDADQILTNKKNEEASNIAIKNTEARKAAKAAKDAKSAADKLALAEASAAKVRAEQRSQSLANDLSSIKREVDEAKESLAAVEQKKKSAQTDALFFAEYAKTVRANQEGAKATYRKVVDAENARIEAERARLAAEAAEKAKK